MGAKREGGLLQLVKGGSYSVTGDPGSDDMQAPGRAQQAKMSASFYPPYKPLKDPTQCRGSGTGQCELRGK